MPALWLMYALIFAASRCCASRCLRYRASVFASAVVVFQLTASVSEKGRELSRVWEWNEEYGEVKKKRPEASAHHLSMYL